MLTKLDDRLWVLNLEKLNMIGWIGTYSYIILYTAGLVTLAYMTFRVKNWRIYSLLIVLSLALFFCGFEEAISFNLVSSLLLIYTCLHYAFEYRKSKNERTFILLIAFISLLISGLGFVFAYGFYMNFVIQHALEFASYVLIIVSLVLTLRKK